MKRLSWLFLPLVVLPLLGGGPREVQRPELRAVSPHSYADTIQRVKEATAAAKFSVVFELDITARAKEKGIAIPSTVILGVCSAKHAAVILAEDVRSVANLPCRIAITERGGKVEVWALDVTQIAEHYQGARMEQTAKEVDTAMRKILAEATAR